jgi:hypothetical protein
MIFWREAWLRRVSGPGAELSISTEAIQHLAPRLKTRVSAAIYVCQASELLKATYPLTKWDRIRKSLTDVAVGNYSAVEMVRYIAVWGNTVYLEGSMCGCAHVAFGACSRHEFT